MSPVTVRQKHERPVEPVQIPVTAGGEDEGVRALTRAVPRGQPYAEPGEVLVGLGGVVRPRRDGPVDPHPRIVAEDREDVQ
jgi:hypothetical protein